MTDFTTFTLVRLGGGRSERLDLIVPPTRQQLAAARKAVSAAVAAGSFTRRYQGRTVALREHLALLRKHDREWLDRVDPLPLRPARGSRQSEKYKEQLHRLDQELAASVHRRAANLRAQSGEPVRLTARALLFNSTSREIHNLRPLTQAAALSHRETGDAFRRRCIGWAIANPGSFATSEAQLVYVALRLRGIKNQRARAVRILGKGVLEQEDLI